MERPFVITSIFVLVFLGISFFIYYWAFSGMIREGLENTNAYSYIPDKSLPNQRKDGIQINDFLHESSLVLDFIKVDNELVAKKDPSANKVFDTAGEYSKVYTDLDIYKEFTAQPDLTKSLDLYYGDILNKEKVGGKPDNEIDAFLDSNADMKSYNQIYNYIYYSTLNPKEKYNKNRFTHYFGGLIKRYKTKIEQLDEIKKFFYSLIKPIYQSKTLFNLYLKNESLYNKKDGDTKDSALYAINTVYEYLSKLSQTVTEDFKNVDKDGNVYCFEADQTDKTFSMDSIKFFQSIGVLLEVKKFVENVKNKKKIDMSVEKFVSGFQTYLFKYNKVEKDQQSNLSNHSVLIYLLDHPVSEKKL